MSRLDSLEILPITSTSLVESWLLALKHQIYAADEIQISSSKESNCSLFLGADRKLIHAALKEKLNAVNIESDPQKAIVQINHD
jgi:predicted nucleic acid-binding protein